MTRVGIIVPSTNSMVERDFHASMPADVSTHTARMLLSETTAENERVMVEDYLPGAARDLATVRPEVVAFACTSAGASIGHEAEARLIEDVGKVTGAPVVSTNSAVHKALTAAGNRRVVVLTPYVDELVEAIRAGIERVGFEVPVAAGMGIVDPFDICEVTDEQMIALADEHVPEGEEDLTIFYSCTNLPAADLRPAVRERFGVPVITSNQATIDGVLEVLGRGPASSNSEER